MKLSKRLLSGLLTILILCSFVLSNVIIAGATEQGEETVADSYGITLLDDGSAEIISYVGESADVEIPAEIGGYIVTKIGVNAFYGALNLVNVVIPDTVTELGNYAFYGCSNMEIIDIPNSVVTIGNSAFRGCSSLKSVTLPQNLTTLESSVFYDCSSLESAIISDSVVTIGDSAFYGCTSLKEISIPNTVTMIEGLAFIGCSSLESVNVPASVKTIGDGAFRNCTSLTEINVDMYNANYYSIDGVLFKGDNDVLVQYPAGRQTPHYSVIEGTSKINNGAFYGCQNLISIDISTTVSNIANMAFTGCVKLAEITIPDSVVSIGSYAFKGCINLSSITILNPDCEIKKSKDTIISTAVIYGYEGSTAQTYAENYSREFVVLSNEPTESMPTEEPNESEPIVTPTVPTTTEPTESVPTTTESTEKPATEPTESVKTTVTLKKSSATLYITGTTNIDVVVANPVGATKYTSSNSKVATVDANGKVVAKKNGTAIISVNNNGVSKEYKVTVKKPTLNSTKQTIKVGKKFKLKITGQIGKATFTSTKTKFATVNSKGKIVGKKKGKTTIKVKVNGITLKCKVTVK